MSNNQHSAVALDFFEKEAKDVAGPFTEQLEAGIQAFRITTLADKIREECLRAIPVHSDKTIDGFVAVELLSITRKTLLKFIHAAEDATTDQQVDSDQDSQLKNLKRRKSREPYKPIDEDAIRKSADGYLEEIEERDRQIADSGALNGDATDADVRESFVTDLGYPEDCKKGPLPSEVFRNAVRATCMGIIESCTSEVRLAPIMATGLVTPESIGGLIGEIIELSGKLQPPSDEI